MPDIFNAAPSVISNNIMQPIRENHSAEISSIDIPDNVKIAKMYSNSEIVEQSDNLNQQISPEVFMEMLKDPNITVNFIKNIFALQDIINAVSTKDFPLAEEFKQLLSELNIKPENLVNELINQENQSTLFKGELFDLLREFVKESPAPGAQISVANLLKAINNENSKSEILKNISETLKHLSDMMPSTNDLPQKLESLAIKFSLPNAKNNFTELKNEAEELIGYIDKNSKTIHKAPRFCSMIKYNLSRFTNNKNAIDKSLRDVMKFIPKEEHKTELMQKLYEHMSGIETNQTNSKILDAFIKIFQNKANIEESLQTGSENIGNNIETTLYLKNQNIIGELETIFEELDAESENIINELINDKSVHNESAENSKIVYNNSQKNDSEVDLKSEYDNEVEINLNNETENNLKSGYKSNTEYNLKDNYQNELFNSLRELLNKSTKPGVKLSVTKFLTAFNFENKKNELINKFIDSFKNISDSMASNKDLVQKLQDLSQKNIINETTKEILKFVPNEEDKIKFVKNLYGFISETQNINANLLNSSDSKIFDALIKVFQNHIKNDDVILKSNENDLEGTFLDLFSENKSAVEELKNIFEDIYVKSNNIVDEIENLEYELSTAKNEINKNLFDELSKIIKENPSEDVKSSVRNLLKSIITENTKLEISKEFSRQLSDLSKNILSNKSLYENLRTVKTDDSLDNAIKNLLKFIPKEEQKEVFLSKVYENFTNIETKASDSKILNTLVKILQKQTDSEGIMQMKGSSVETVIHSLLSSPSNFSPLLHFVIPIDDGIFKAFGEMWINTDEEDKRTKNDAESTSENNEKIMHMLIVFDIPDTGHFETELWVKGKSINMSLLCPPIMEKYSSELSADLKKSISFSEYRFDEIKVGKLEKKRSLVEVFPTLPQKRAGINVRI